MFCDHFIFSIHILIFVWKQLEKIPIDEIKKELKSAGLSDVAIEELLQILSVKSLAKLEGFAWHMFYLLILLFSFLVKKFSNDGYQ